MPADRLVACEWAAWANGAAVRELDFHDNFFAAESAHPGDSIASILAVAQQCGAEGSDLVRAIATAYEIQIDLCKAIGLALEQVQRLPDLGRNELRSLSIEVASSRRGDLDRRGIF
jgi:2-methylcitrate dehydratase